MMVNLDGLAEKVNAWCARHRVIPANGQAGDEMTVRTLRYYRTVNLLDAPLSGGGSGYGQRHFLQACAVRALQAQGLPIARIQSLLFAQGDAELQQILDTAEAGSATQPQPASLPQPEIWHTCPLNEDLMIISRKSPLHLTPDQFTALKKILSL